MRQSAALALALVLCVAQWSTALAGFFVCPSPCQAKLLPRDMESLEDCLCQGDVSALLDNNNANPGTAFRCPEGSSAKRLHPMSFADCACLSGYTRDDMRKTCTSAQFQCRGRYRPKEGVTDPESIAECDCQHPYKKDEATGQCVLRKCPRAGNYIKKSGVGRVASLADCACIDQYLKNEQSGECMVDTVFQCPTFSQPMPSRRVTSFADCECDWGFVRSPKNTCEREAAPYACPKHSIKRANLGIGERARSFADCECEDSTEFRRNEKLHKCERINDDVDGDGVDELDPDDGFVCPPMSKALAPFPHSIEQCECLPGFGWKTPEMTCVRLSGYTCPPHSYKADDAKHIEERFSDCDCARGYYRDDSAGACLEWFLANDNGCPEFAFLRHWPLQSKANCQCIYGLSVPSPEPTMDQDQDDDGEETESPQQRQRKQLRQQKRTYKKKPAAQCNRPPPEFLGGSFSECPINSVAINWPLASSDDCLCKEGFGIAPLGEDGVQRGDGASFVCVDPTESITEDGDDEPLTTVSCKPPMVKNPFTSDCRLPVEQVRPRNSRKSKDDLPARGEVLFKGIEYDYVLTEDNVMVIQGDVAIGELVTWSPSIGEDGTPVATDRPMPPPTPVLHGYYNSERDHRWEDATMCFEVDASAEAFESVVDEAMDHITAVTNFKFRQCRGNDCHTDATCAHDFVSVKKTSSSCYSYVGRIGGKQLLGVSAECGLGNIIHVLLHAVGLHHTIDRADRDDHVRIAWECVPENQRANFVVEDLNVTSSAIDTPYDFFSIMHHPADTFVRTKGVRSAIPQWCQSIFPIIALPEERVAVMARMGQRQLLAVTDIHAVWKLYPTLQSQDKPPTYESVTANGDSDKAIVHESRLHTQDDVVSVDGKAGFAKKNGKSSWAKKISSFFGAMVTLVGFGLFVSFAVVEFRRRALIHSSGGYYSESLLSDKAMYD